MINEITANITAITGFPQRSNYISSSAYALAVETWLGEQQGLSEELTTLISQLITFINETNAEADTVNDYMIETLGYKNDALDAKDIAIAQAIIAQGAVSTLPSGIINDATISTLDAWSSNKIVSYVDENTPVATTSPILSGNNTVYENFSLIVTIDNYSPTATYTISNVICSASRVGDTITIIANEVTADIVGNISVTAKEDGEETSAIAVFGFTIVNVVQVEDQSLVYDSGSMNEFTDLTNVTVGTEIVGSTFNHTHIAISNTITQDVADTDFVGLTDGTTPFISKFELTNISTATVADILTTYDEIVDGDKLIIVKEDDSVNEVIASGVSSEAGLVSSIDPFGDGSLVAKYEFVDSGSTTVTDTVGNYPATESGTFTYPTGRTNFGTAIATAGGSITMATGMITGGAAFTYSFWVKQSTAKTMYLLGMGSNATNQRLDVRIADDGRIHLMYYGSSSYSPVGAFAFDGNWHHIVIAAATSSATSTVMYVDGTAVTTTNPSITRNTTTNYACIFGADGAVTARAIDGYDQVEIYNKALTSTEVNTLYTQTATKYIADITSITQGEIPSRVFVDAKVEFDTGSGFTEATEASRVVTGGGTFPDVSTPLQIDRTYSDLIVPTGFRTLKTKVTLGSSGDSMSELSAQITKEA